MGALDISGYRLRRLPSGAFGKGISPRKKDCQSHARLIGFSFPKYLRGCGGLAPRWIAYALA
jgi:hypothetical protein